MKKTKLTMNIKAYILIIISLLKKILLLDNTILTNT